MAKPDFLLESSLTLDHHSVIAGLDEAGRGSLAGPVVVAAVILNTNHIPPGIDDSKKLKPPARARIAEVLLTEHHVSLAYVSPSRIDCLNILQATLYAMKIALHALDIRPDIALVDGPHAPKAVDYCKMMPIINGDNISLSIAAASIVAKVFRDRYMINAANIYKGYGFEQNMGYGTSKHLLLLQQMGPCPIHRRSFAPVASSLAAKIIRTNT